MLAREEVTWALAGFDDVTERESEGDVWAAPGADALCLILGDLEAAAEAGTPPDKRTPSTRTIRAVRRMRGVRRIQSIFSVRRMRPAFECLYWCRKV